ncbi:MAG: hypothetical protein KC619_15430 [Myxococcales bacterium]|nr:hypothetical protein [Myxococcales bacterium]
MIAMLTGELVHQSANRGVLDVNGVGYEVFATTATLGRWSLAGRVRVHVSTQVREDAITLYGFDDDAERAAFLAAQVRHRAVREGYSFLEGEALLIRVCADLSLGRTVELARGVEELSNLAAAFQFRRYRVLARLVGSALEEEPDVPLLLAMREEDASPMAARVAACLLGGPPVRDAMDRLLYEGLSARWRSRVEPLEAGRDPSWVFDPGRRVVYLPERAPSATPLALRILDGLFEAGGAASLPEVARFGWDIDEYHQLRDSKRVHVAIRRLRRAIEDDPSKPTRLVTTEEGYGFCGDAPPARIRPR